MAISEDTIALVAAQLTAAWATRKGAGGAPANIAEQELIATYEYFRTQVAPRHGPARQVPLGGT